MVGLGGYLLPNGGENWGGAVPLPRQFLDFLPRNDAFCMHFEAFIRQFTKSVTIMLKSAKRSDIVSKPCNVVTVL